MKKTIALTVLITSLTGCVVAPFDDHPNRNNERYDQDKRYDRDHKRQDWQNQKRGDWNKQRDQRADWDRERPRSDQPRPR